MSEEEPKDTQTLVASMAERAEAQRAQILSEARQKRDEMLADADARIAKMQADAEERLAGELAIERDRTLGLAQMERRNARLSARRRMLDRVFDAAAERLEDGSADTDYAVVLRELAREAVQELGTRDVELTVREEDREEGQRVAEELELSGDVATRDGDRGTVDLTTTDGLRSVDNSLSTRLAHARSELATDIAEILFGDVDDR